MSVYFVKGFIYSWDFGHKVKGPEAMENLNFERPAYCHLNFDEQFSDQESLIRLFKSFFSFADCAGRLWLERQRNWLWKENMGYDKIDKI